MYSREVMQRNMNVKLKTLASASAVVLAIGFQSIAQANTGVTTNPLWFETAWEEGTEEYEDRIEIHASNTDDKVDDAYSGVKQPLVEADVSPTTIPEPSSVIGLGMLTLFALGTRLKRKARQS
mgnify:CR=1 FL=1